MTKGSGCSACCRGGVTYGYRECLRKGRVRKSCDASSPVKHGSTDLRRACMQGSERERSRLFFRLPAKFPHQSLESIFPVSPQRPYIKKITLLLSRCLRARCEIFSKILLYSTDQKTFNLPCNGRYTALMPAEMSCSNRLRRRLQVKNLMPIRHRVGVYGIRRRFLASE
ncbi:hypothetical protein D3C73_943730 [compost metagenome]